MQRAASRSSAIINFDAINQRQFFRSRCNQHEKLAQESGVEFRTLISGACQRLYTQVSETSQFFARVCVTVCVVTVTPLAQTQETTG